MFHTVKHSKAVLSGGRQGLAGGVQLVTIVTDADLELDWLAGLLQHARTVENGAQRELPSPLVFLHSRKKYVPLLEVRARLFFLDYFARNSIYRQYKHGYFLWVDCNKREVKKVMYNDFYFRINQINMDTVVVKVCTCATRMSSLEMSSTFLSTFSSS